MSSRGAFFMGSRLRLTPFLRLFRFARCRRLGAPGFREANSAARLGQIFSELASKGIELSAVNVVAPQLTEPPGLDEQNGMLHLKGYFPGKPTQLDFDLLYQAVDGRWRVFGLSVLPTAATAQPLSASGEAGASTHNK
jgi:hypothetical protein